MAIAEPIQIDKVTIAIDNLPDCLSGTKIIQRLNLHFGRVCLSASLQQAIAGLLDFLSPEY